MKKIISLTAVLFTVASALLFSTTILANNLISSAPVLTLEGAKVIAKAAHQKAQDENWNVIIVISDASANIKYLERMEDVQLASLDIAIKKAQTAVQYRRPTQVFAELLADNKLPIASLPNVLPFAGGLPIIIDGQVIGAVGVSGVKASQDAEIAQAGIDALIANIRTSSTSKP